MKKLTVLLKMLSLVLSAGLVMSDSLIATANMEPNLPNLDCQTASANPSTQCHSERTAPLRFKVQGVRQTRTTRRGGFPAGGFPPVGVCDGERIDLIALLPQNNRQVLREDELEVEQTVSLNPTFLVYLSETQAREAEFFVLNEARDQFVYSQDIALTGDAGMLSLTIPKSTDPNKSLQVGQKYYWGFTVRCDTSGDGWGDQTVSGWVQVVSKEGALAGVDNMSEEQRLQVYADNDIWTDLVSSLAELREENPTVWEEDWKSVLESVGLADVMGNDSTNASPIRVEN